MVLVIFSPTCATYCWKRVSYHLPANTVLKKKIKIKICSNTT